MTTMESTCVGVIRLYRGFQMTLYYEKPVVVWVTLWPVVCRTRNLYQDHLEKNLNNNTRFFRNIM